MNKVVTFLKQQIGKQAADTPTPSPLMVWLNPILRSVEEGEVVFEYKVRKEMTNPIGILHGGISAAIIDDAIGTAVYTFGEEHFYSTINNAIDYMSSAYENDIVVAETKITKKGRQLINAECSIWNADRTKLIAKGYSNLIRTTIAK